MIHKHVTQNSEGPPPRKSRRLRRVAILTILAVGGLIVGLPTLLSTRPASAWLLGKLNEQVAPGRIEVGSLDLSWWRSITLKDLALADASGARVVAVDRVKSDRSILAILKNWNDLGTLTITGADIQIHRRTDGSIDVLDALQGLMREKPDEPKSKTTFPSLEIEIADGTLRVETPELAEPLMAETLSGRVVIRPNQPIEVSLTLGHQQAELALQATYNTENDGQSTAALNARAWPLALRTMGLDGRGQLEGTLEANSRAGLWAAKGALSLAGLDATGPLLAGDRLRLERLTANLDIAQTAEGWDCRRLDLESAAASVVASGHVPPHAEGPFHFETNLDLAELSRQLPRAVPLREGVTIERGQMRLKADLAAEGDREILTVDSNFRDLLVRESGRTIALSEPPVVSGRIVRQGEAVTVETLTVKAAGIDAKASGDLDRGVTLSGHVDLAALQGQLREVIDTKGIRARGRVGLAADYRRAGNEYQARFAAECRGLVVEGATAEPWSHDVARIDASSTGPRIGPGWPGGWTTARLAVKAGEIQADATATSAAEAIALKAKLQVPVAGGGIAGLDASTHIKASIIEIDDVSARFAPAGTDPAKALSCRVRGRWDSAKGELVLQPVDNNLTGPIGVGSAGLKVTGLGQSGALPVVDGELMGELAALDALLASWNGTPLRGFGGRWVSKVAIQPGANHDMNLGIALHIGGLTTPEPRGDVDLRYSGTYHSDRDALDIASLDLGTGYGKAHAEGAIDELSGRRLARLGGTLDPQWTMVQQWLVRSIEPSATMAAKTRPFQIAGPLAGGSVSEILSRLQGELGLDVASAHAYGLDLGPTPIILRLGNGRAVFDPIQTTLNGGQMTVRADLAIEDPDRLDLRLYQGTQIRDAAINHVVAATLLLYVAPVLSEATDVLGQVSVTVDNGRIPLIGTDHMDLVGQIVFNGVVFQPGAFAAELITLTGQKVPKLTLNQPLQMQIRNGRVHQEGLSVALSGDAKMDLAGSVGFDRTLKLRASLPLTAKMLGHDELVQQIASGTKMTLPISGTLSKPGIDRQAFQVALRDAAKSVVKRGLETGAQRLLNEAAKPVTEAIGGAAKRKGAKGNDPLKILEGLGREILDPK